MPSRSLTLMPRAEHGISGFARSSSPVAVLTNRARTFNTYPQECIDMTSLPKREPSPSGIENSVTDAKSSQPLVILRCSSRPFHDNPSCLHHLQIVTSSAKRPPTIRFHTKDRNRHHHGPGVVDPRRGQEFVQFLAADTIPFICPLPVRLYRMSGDRGIARMTVLTDSRASREARGTSATGSVNMSTSQSNIGQSLSTSPQSQSPRFGWLISKTKTL